MRIKYHFEMLELDDLIIAVPIGESKKVFKGVIKMNDSGAVIFELLQNNISEEEIMEILNRRYDDCTETNLEYAHKFINVLRENGVLEI